MSFLDPKDLIEVRQHSLDCLRWATFLTGHPEIIVRHHAVIATKRLCDVIIQTSSGVDLYEGDAWSCIAVDPGDLLDIMCDYESSIGRICEAMKWANKEVER